MKRKVKTVEINKDNCIMCTDLSEVIYDMVKNTLKCKIKREETENSITLKIPYIKDDKGVIGLMSENMEQNIDAVNILEDTFSILMYSKGKIRLKNKEQEKVKILKIEEDEYNTRFIGDQRVTEEENEYFDKAESLHKYFQSVGCIDNYNKTKSGKITMEIPYVQNKWEDIHVLKENAPYEYDTENTKISRLKPNRTSDGKMYSVTPITMDIYRAIGAIEYLDYDYWSLMQAFITKDRRY